MFSPNSLNSLNSSKMEKQTFTVTELNNRIKNLLDRYRAEQAEAGIRLV